ncbi:hypothetical protein O0I10_000921 [Lichtheimia ornata]|uniref:BAR domain-containing protein n=1 Tax=Lichtheimia ornata TaxID=688661 RepID=A0AAD7Y4J5_9FUNG|nr:uncharacterized protein O0I10_000921 [Lichtheimia ornata]KAJ8663673.1 hypothetical protein O0I10_000921 [Lichtheimia ornata]
MSFLHGFKKNLNRAGTTLMQKTGAVDRTEDSEFADEYERFKILEKKCEKLSKNAKAFLDAMRAMTTTQLRIAQTLGLFYDDWVVMSQGGREYVKTIERFNEETKTDLDKAFQTTVLEPLARLCSYFPEINEAVKRRKKKQLDYDAQKSKVRKLIDRPSEDPQKLPMAEQEADLAREMYEGLNTILITDLPKVVDLRVPYLDPSFEALIKTELLFSQKSYEELEALRPQFSQEMEQGQDTRVDDILQQMRSLTITGNF